VLDSIFAGSGAPRNCLSAAGRWRTTGHRYKQIRPRLPARRSVPDANAQVGLKSAVENVAQTKRSLSRKRWISNRRDITVGVSFERKGIIKAARLTSEMVLSMRAVSDAEQYRSAFVVNPATGALEIRAELRPKIERALRRDTYLHALRSYLCLPSIDCRLFFAECAYALSRTARYLVCEVSEFPGNIHGAPP
jgi:hypothetical protein